MTSKIQQTTEDLQNHFNEQIEFLKNSIESYDSGFQGEAKRMAAVVRTLVHDTNVSHSLLGQLSLKEQTFLSTSEKNKVDGPNLQLIGSYAGLLGIDLKGGYVPYLDEYPPHEAHFLDFDSWWKEIVFIDGEKNTYSRKEIILSVANQDGGSHVDPELDNKYAKLSRQNGLGWTHADSDGKSVAITGAELAAVRQITHEILRSLFPEYPIQKMKIGDTVIIGTQMALVLAKPKKIGRGVKCPCGSNKKYRKCGYLNTELHQKFNKKNE